MKKLKLAALLFGLIFTNSLNGQYSDFDLSKYKLPDINTQRLDVYFDMNNSVNNQNQNHYYSPLNTTSTKENDIEGSLDLTYYRFRNSQNYQGYLSVSTEFSPSVSNASENELQTKNRYINANLSISGVNRYFNKKMNFIEVGPYFSFRPIREKEHHDLSPTIWNETYSNQSSTSISIPVAIGHGRIEPVEDARLAIYILEELNKIGVISALPSDETVIEMAKEISKIKNERFFDSRLRKIKELQVIDSFLVANDIVSANDINYFSVLNDNWDYAYGPSRESGFSYNAGLDNGISFTRLKGETTSGDYSYESGYKRNTYLAGAFINVNYAKPINLYWQTSAHFQTSYILEFTRDPEHKESQEANYRTDILSTDFGFSLQYLPNSRTSMELTINGLYQNAKGDRTSGVMIPTYYYIKNNSLALNPGLYIYYYVSPQFQIQLNSSFTIYSSDQGEYITTTPFKKDSWNYYKNNISVKLVYSIF